MVWTRVSGWRREVTTSNDGDGTSGAACRSTVTSADDGPPAAVEDAAADVLTREHSSSRPSAATTAIRWVLILVDLALQGIMNGRCRCDVLGGGKP